MPLTKREKRISRMKKRGLRLTKTEQELLIGMGFDRRLISSWAAGDKMPDKFNAALIAGIVGRPLAEILFGNSFPRKKMKRGRPKKRKNITA
jgi:transcriptional regulator with XRE-family HTH domain